MSWRQRGRRLVGRARARRGNAWWPLTGLVAAACTPQPPPRWDRLAAGFEPPDPEALVARWNRDGGALTYRAAPDGVWVETTLPPGWNAEPNGKRWRLPLPPEPRLELRDRVELWVDGVPLALPARGTAGPKAQIVDDMLVLNPAGAGAPHEARLALWLERARGGRSAANADGWSRIEDGLDVWPGERVELVRDVPAGSVLRFEERVRAFAPRGAVTFRVRLDDRVLHERTVDLAGDLTSPPAAIALGTGARPGARLVFEVEGAPAATAFARPVLAPADIGQPDARPWSAGPPDVVLFVADTFRADLLAAYGGTPGLTPALDALAARSVLFREARSTSTWTLPAHASLFTGTWPTQHCAQFMWSALDGKLDTLAELFARAGYRTAAVTDGLYLTRDHGIDQGFESFEVQHEDGRPRLPGTLEAARALALADDGRPLFLFVQTYRTHWPYSSGADEDATVAKELRQRATELYKSTQDEAERLRLLAAPAREMHEHYRGGAHALDVQFGPWFRDLEEQGLFRHGLFLFTSDHGEAFLEHGHSWHGGKPHDEVARVPLFFFGAGEAPREVRLGASLIDLAPTLAARCGIAPLPHWSGRDLFALDEERLLFVSVREEERQHVGIVQGGRKLLASGAAPVRLPANLEEAYALDSDRAERANLLDPSVPDPPAWPAELAGAAAPAWEALLVPLTEAIRIEIDEEHAAELRRLGYGGEQE